MFPSNLQVAAIKGLSLSFSLPLSVGEEKQARMGLREGGIGFFFWRPIKRYSLCAIAATATRRNHSRLPAFLSPHPKQTESNKHEFDTRGNFLLSSEISHCKCCCKPKEVHHRLSPKSDFWSAASIASTCRRTPISLSLSLSPPRWLSSG